MSNFLEQCPVPILQSPWEFQQLFDIYHRSAPAKVLEIGSFYGGTLWYWLQATVAELEWVPVDESGFGGPCVAKPVGKMVKCVKSLISVDYPIGPSDGRYEEMMRCRAMWPEWTAGIEFHDVQGDSHNPITVQRVKQIYPNNDVDFLFIDGDHSYEGVMADFEHYAPLVRSGGLVVLHDIAGLPEVKQYWQVLKTCYKTTEIVEPGGWGIGIIEM